MKVFLIITVITFLIGIFLFLKERRSFFAGIFLVLGSLEFIFSLIYMLASAFHFFNIIAFAILFILFPIGIIIGAFLLIKNGKAMKQKEGLRLANMLSFFLGIYIFIIISLTSFQIYNGYKLNVFVSTTIVVIILISVYFGLLFMSYLIYSYIYQKMAIKKNLDYIIVLGSGLIGDRVPPLLKSRLDKGIEIYKQQLQMGNKTKLIVSGGQGQDELTSEADAMKKYLLSQNILDSDVIKEEKSTTTYENMKFSKEIMDNFNLKYSCIFVTNNYHVFRAAIFARKVGLHAHGLGAPTSFYFLPSALIREFIAILVLHKWFHIIFIVLFLIFTIISFLPFNLF